MNAMRLLSLFALAIFSLTGSARAGSPAEEEVLTLERGIAEAWLKADVDWIAQHEADEFVFTGSEGAVSSKADDIASLKSGASKFESFVIDEMRAMAFGDSAVVVGQATMKGSYLGKDYSGSFRFTDTFVKRDGRWQLVASQNTRIAKP